MENTRVTFGGSKTNFWRLKNTRKQFVPVTRSATKTVKGFFKAPIFPDSRKRASKGRFNNG
jgi:hypothetical protein